MMKIFLVLVVGAMHTPLSESTLYFQPIGQFNPSPSYGHIHFVIDTHLIKKQMTDVKDAIAYIRKMVHTISHDAVQHRARNFLLRAHLDIDTMIDEFKDLQSIAENINTNEKRTKRFLGMLLAISSITMSLFNQAEILHLQGEISDIVSKHNHLVDIVQEHEVALHTLKHDVLKIKDGFISLANIVEENNAKTKIHEAELEIVMALSELRRTLGCTQYGIQSLLNHRVPLCFLNTPQIKKSLDNLSIKATNQHMEIISKHIASFLQYETSFLLTQGHIHVYVHVPLVNRDSLLDLLRFNNAPTQISDTLTLQLTPPDSILAIGQNGLHITMTQSELDQCPKYGHIYVGNSAVTLKNRINTTCLGTIYSQDYKNIRNVCPTKFSADNEVFIPIAPNEFIFYTKTPQTIQIKCKGETKHIVVQQQEKITMKDNCEIKSSEHTTRSGHTLQMESETRRWPFNWNASGLLFNLDSASLASYVHDLKLIHYPPTPARDLHHLMITPPHSFWTWMTMLILIMATLITAIFFYLAYRYFIIRKKASQEAGV